MRDALVSIAKITCPALMLAARRNARVRGRIKELMTSTIARNHESGRGEDSGINEACKEFGFVRIIVITIANHIGKDRDMVNLRWEVNVGKIGNAPEIFNVKIR